MRPYCEKIVTEVFPQVRAMIAKTLTKNLGYTQAEAAAKMGITQPAISQYLKEMRATKVSLLEKCPDCMQIIEEAAKNLSTSNTPLHSGIMCDICKKLRATGIMEKL